MSYIAWLTGHQAPHLTHSVEAGSRMCSPPSGALPSQHGADSQGAECSCQTLLRAGEGREAGRHGAAGIRWALEDQGTSQR